MLRKVATTAEPPRVPYSFTNAAPMPCEPPVITATFLPVS
jgi:hypothetical protein